ncbi:hypothetical protein [Paracoccus sp. MA]
MSSTKLRAAPFQLSSSSLPLLAFSSPAIAWDPNWRRSWKPRCAT